MPKDKAPGELIGVRCPANLVGAIDEWRRKQPDIPSRAEAIRRLVAQSLQSSKRKPLKSE
jgi:metal-responsive CopG/Arc/MetJ family transcriptional regulator